jgi:hypothetical protein
MVRLQGSSAGAPALSRSITVPFASMASGSSIFSTGPAGTILRVTLQEEDALGNDFRVSHLLDGGALE